MRRILLSAALAALLPVLGFAQKPAIPKDPTIESNIQKLLNKMTLQEKVGQMLELNADVFGFRAETDLNQIKAVLKKHGISESEASEIVKMREERMLQTISQKGISLDEVYPIIAKKTWTFDEKKLEDIIKTYKIGSILNTPGGSALPADQWNRIIAKIQELSMKHIGIPCIYGLDQNHGVTYTQDGTLFPQPINVASSFNTDIARTASQITAYESRATDCPWVYNPTLDLGRDPRWSRIWESYGEDATVNARMAEAAVKGYQGDDNNHLGKYNVATSVKHYFAYGAPFSGKDRTPAYVSPLMLREKYFAPFKAAIQAGALTVMVNSASINGTPVHASYEYLTQWLKTDLNWDGMIVTDWADIDNLWKREKVAKDKKDAIRIAINAGVDMSMDPYSTDFCDLLIELVNEGKVPMSRIDDAVARILRVKYRLGLFDTPDTKVKDYPEFGSDKHAKIALEAAQECEVLLKNEDNILPLKKGTKILVTGPNANSVRVLDGGWSYTWQGSATEAFTVKYNSIYKALSNKFGASNVILEQGVTYNERGSYWDENEPEFDKAVAAARNVDVIVACIGENSYCETPGNLTDLNLSQNQKELVRRLAATGKPVVLIIGGGRPRLLSEIEPLAKAVVDIFLPGNYGADALANLLSGDANFSARMPYTYPKEINSLINYDYKVSEEVSTMAGAYDYDAKVTLQWPFGYGLSYTTFEYSNLKVDKANFTANDVLKVSVDVKNTGSVAGKESVLIYTSDLVASIVPDNRRLRAFTKIDLKPGETKTVTLTIPAKDLAFVGADGKWILEEGEFVISTAKMGVKTNCTATKKWDTPNID